jgi:hypothetical protein
VWVRRYAPAEAAATLAVALTAGAVDQFGVAAATAYATAIAEGVVFYAVLFVRDLVANLREVPRTAAGEATRCHSVRLTVRGLVLECGPAEILDTLLIRPAAMYAGPAVVGSLTAGVILGKVAADLAFYVVAIIGYELRTSRALASTGSLLRHRTFHQHE